MPVSFYGKQQSSKDAGRNYSAIKEKSELISALKIL